MNPNLPARPRKRKKARKQQPTDQHPPKDFTAWLSCWRPLEPPPAAYTPSDFSMAHLIETLLTMEQPPAAVNQGSGPWLHYLRKAVRPQMEQQAIHFFELAWGEFERRGRFGRKGRLSFRDHITTRAWLLLIEAKYGSLEASPGAQPTTNRL